MTDQPTSSEPVATLDEAEQEWQAFQAVERLRNHWDRPDWTDGRRSYHWLIEQAGGLEMTQLAADCSRALSDLPYLDPVDRSTMHITLKRIGFTDEVSWAQVYEMRKRNAAALQSIQPFEIAVGPLAGSPGAVRFSVTPHEPLNALRDSLLSLTDNGDAGTYVPHMSIAYSNADVPAGEVISRVAELRQRPAVTMPVEYVDLVELRRDRHAYKWRHIERIVLGAKQRPLRRLRPAR